MVKGIIDLNEISNAIKNGEPYLDRQVFGIQSNPVRYGYMFDLVRHICADREAIEPISILEIGSWVGASAIAWGTAIKDYNAGLGLVTCVDPWKEYRTYRTTSSPPDDRMNVLFEHQIPLTLFQHNIKVFGLEDMVIPIKATGKEVISQLPDKSFDIIYQDGNRLLKYIVEDIELAKPKVKNGGYLVGDDLVLQMNEVNREEMAAAINLNIEMIKDSQTSKVYLPALTLAVSKCFDKVSVVDGFWWVKCEKNRWSPIDISLTNGIPDYVSQWI